MIRPNSLCMDQCPYSRCHGGLRYYGLSDAMNRVRVVSPRTPNEEGTRLRAGRSYYSEGLIRSPTEGGSPRGNGLTDDLWSCRSYYPCRCPNMRPICLGDRAL